MGWNHQLDNHTKPSYLNCLNSPTQGISLKRVFFQLIFAQLDSLWTVDELEALGAEKQTLEILSESLKIVNQYNVTWRAKDGTLLASFFLEKGGWKHV